MSILSWVVKFFQKLKDLSVSNFDFFSGPQISDFVDQCTMHIRAFLRWVARVAAIASVADIPTATFHLSESGFVYCRRFRKKNLMGNSVACPKFCRFEIGKLRKTMFSSIWHCSKSRTHTHTFTDCMRRTYTRIWMHSPL